MDADVRTPQQDRSRKSLERVLKAGIALLAEKGYDGFSIADVSARSGVSVGSIYQRFQSKAVLFIALQERILKDVDAEQETLFASIDTRRLDDGAIVDAAVHRMADHLRRHEALLRVMIVRGAIDEATRARGSRSSLTLARNFEHFLAGTLRHVAHEAPAIAVDVSFRIIYASLTRRILSGPTFESTVELPWETFVAELSRACGAYLLGAGRA